MAKISIEIDTENRDLKEGVNLTSSPGQTPLSTTKKLGVLSSIQMTTSSPLFAAIKFGYDGPIDLEGSIAPNDVTDLKNKRNDLVTQKHSQLIATVGGLWANTGIAGTPVPFVSLVGNIPDTPDPKCFGGVSLESWRSNAQRRNYLTQNTATQLNQIGLYHSPPPGGAGVGNVPWDEEYEWNHSGAGAITPATVNFGQDLNTVGPGIKALVIGASPFFLSQNNMSSLVTALNGWLSADATRFVVYPLQIYNEAGPASGSILLGPDLYHACRLLGFLAQEVAEVSGVGFLGFLRLWNQTTVK
jgi:hypothetical protein